MSKSHTELAAIWPRPLPSHARLAMRRKALLPRSAKSAATVPVTS